VAGITTQALLMFARSARTQIDHRVGGARKDRDADPIPVARHVASTPNEGDRLSAIGS
jgi:hypothetical protein